MKVERGFVLASVAAILVVAAIASSVLSLHVSASAKHSERNACGVGSLEGVDAA